MMIGVGWRGLESPRPGDCRFEIATGLADAGIDDLEIASGDIVDAEIEAEVAQRPGLGRVNQIEIAHEVILAALFRCVHFVEFARIGDPCAQPEST